MTNITESSVYEEGIYLLETTDPNLGGVPILVGGVPTTGHANAQAQQLANRTKYLKDAHETFVSDLANATDPAKGAAMIYSGQLSLDRLTPYNVLRHIPLNLHSQIIDRTISRSVDLLSYLNEAVEALHDEHGGGVLWMPQGFYPVKNHLAIPYSNISIFAYGAKLFCDQPTSGGESLLFWYPMEVGAAPSSDAEYVRNNFVFGLTLENTSTGTNENGIAFVRCDGFGAYDCHIEKTTDGQGANRKGIVTHWSRNGYISRNIIDEAGFSGISIEKGTNSKNIWVIDNLIKKVRGIAGDASSGSGIYMSDAGEVGSMSGIRCRGNTIVDASLHGVYAGGLVDPEITSNQVGVVQGRGVYALNCTRPKIKDNTVNASTQQGVIVQNPVGGYDIDDNTIIQSGASTPAIVVVAPTSKGSICDNKITSTSPSAYIDVQSAGSLKNVPEIDGNIIAGGIAPAFANWAANAPGRNHILGLPFPGVWASDNLHQQSGLGTSTAVSLEVPASALGTVRGFSVKFSGQSINSAGANKIARVKFGSTTVAEVINTGNSTFSVDIEVVNDGVTGTQRVTGTIVNGSTVTNVLGVAAIDTTSAQTIVIEAECSGAGELLQLRMMKIRGID